MSETLLIAAAVVVTILASLGFVAVMNRVNKRPGIMQGILDREPMFGKDFLERFYTDLPRNVVFEVRSEFARLAGVPADFLLPEDNLARLAPAGSPDAMREFVAALVTSGRRGAQSDAKINLAEDLATLDDYIRATVALCSAHQHDGAAQVLRAD